MSDEVTKPEPVDYTKKDEQPQGPPKITEPQAYRIKKMLGEQNISDAEMTLMVEDICKDGHKTHYTELSKWEASEFITRLIGKGKTTEEPAQTPAKQENIGKPTAERKEHTQTTQGTAIVPQETRRDFPTQTNPNRGFLRPKYTVNEAVAAFEQFEDAKTKILKSKDITRLGENGAPSTAPNAKVHINRSGWRKLARFFGLNYRIVARQRVDIEGGYMYIATGRVENSNGETVELDGAATSKDPFFTKGGKKTANEEDIVMKAETVALNRAISDMLGSGEVSAEEMEE